MGQYIYILIALVLLMNLVVSVNRVSIGSMSDMVENQVRNDAVSLAQSMIEEVWLKSFDEKLVTGTTQTTWTTVANLGKDSGETYNTLDDIDDYNGYSRSQVWGGSPLTVLVSVNYADPDVTGFDVNWITDWKIVRVTVTSQMNEKIHNNREKVQVSMYHIFAKLSDD